MQNNQKRIPFIDYLRSISIILMFITHTFRLHITTTTDSVFLLKAFNFFMKIEPLTASLFLFLAGFSLITSYQNMKDSVIWNSKINKKIYILFAISFILCILEEGIFPFRLLFSSGILGVIGISLLLIKKYIEHQKSSFIYLLLWGLTLMFSFFLDRFNINLTGLNIGNGAMIPIIGFSFLGAFIAKNFNIISNIKFKNKIYSLSAILISIFMLTKFKWVSVLHSEAYGFHSHTFKIDTALFTNWNQTAPGFASCSLIIILIISLLINIHIKRTFPLIELFSKYSLELYIYHLTLISMFYIFNTGLDGTGLVSLFLLFLVWSSYNLTKIMTKHKIKII